MNQIYRVVFNAVTGVWQATSEIARGHSKSSRSTKRQRRSVMASHAVGLLLLTGVVGSNTAWAACTPGVPTNGVTVTCTGNDQQNFSSAASNLSVNIATGSIISSSGSGDPVLQLTGSNNTVNNSGQIYPSNFGQQSQLTTGLKVGNSSAQNISITNNAIGWISGTSANLGTSIASLKGMALDIEAGSGGKVTLVNNGTIFSDPIIGATLEVADMPNVAVYGGAQVEMTNTNQLYGRVAFQASNEGNIFTNTGTLAGSLSMGAGGGNNRFNAVTGSTVVNGGATGTGSVTVDTNPNLVFVRPGVVDGGAGGSNTLALQNAIGGGSGTAGAGSISSTSFINFSNLLVQGGTWQVSGALLTGSSTSTTLVGGSLSVNNDAVFGSGDVSISGANLTTHTATVNLANNFLIGSGGMALGGTNTIVLNGVISGGGTGGLTKNNGGILRINGINTYAGGTNLNGGTTVVSTDRAFGTGNIAIGSSGARIDASGTVNLANNISLSANGTFGGTGNLTLSGVVSNTTSRILAKVGSGQLTLANANTYQGGTTLSGGTLVVGNNQALGSGTLTVSAASTLASNQAVTLANNAILASNLTIAGANDLSLTGVIDGSTGNKLIKTGSGNLSLSGSNTFSGGVELNSGILTIASVASVLGSDTLTATGNSRLTFDAASSLGNAIAINSGVTLDTRLNQNALLLGALSGAGNLTKTGSGELSLLQTGTLSGVVDVQAGKLTAVASNALGSGTSVNIASGATLSLGADTVLGGLSGSGQLQVTGGAISVGAGNASTTFTGTITGSSISGLTKIGSGTLTLGGVNTYSSNMAVNGGRVHLNSGANISSGAVNVYSGASVSGTGRFNGNLTINSGAHLILGSGGTLSAGALNVGGGSNVDIALGAPSLTAMMSVTSTLTLQSTQLNFSALADIDNGTYRLFDYGGVFNNLGASITALPSGFLPGEITLQYVAGGVNAVVNSLSLIAQYWDGSGPYGNGVVNGGSGVWNSSATNWTKASGNAVAGWQGVAAIFQGTAGQVSIEGPQSASSLQFKSDGYTLGTATGGLLNLVNGTGGSATIGVDAGATALIDGQIGGTGKLEKTGAGTLVLAGSNSYSGGTALTAGTLTVRNNNALGGGLIALYSGTTLRADTTDVQLYNSVILAGVANVTASSGTTLSLSGNLAGAGGLVKIGSGSLVLNGNNSQLGNTWLNAGSLELGSDTALGSGALNTLNNTSLRAGAGGVSIANDIAISGNLLVSGVNDLVLSGALTGNGNLNKYGTGTLTLSGTNTLLGAVALNEGILRLGHGNALGSSTLYVSGASGLQSTASITVANDISLDAQLTVSGSNDLALGGEVYGNSGLIKDGSGQLTLTGPGSYTGNTAVNGGTLRVDGSLTSGNVAVASGATLSGSGSIAGNVTVDNGGHLALRTGSVLSLGTLTLSDTSTIEAALGIANTTGMAHVNGNLTLDGTLNVSDAGGFGLGVYRLFDYGGSLTDRGLAVGTLPTGVQAGDLQVQTSVDKQVNLVVGGASNVRFWDGVGPSNDGVVGGGNGVWNSANASWATSNGGFNQAWNDSFAVFQGTAGTVTVEGTQHTTGMQFASDGYHLVGGSGSPSGQLELVGNGSGDAFIRVDPGVTATLDVALSGSATLAKVDSGTLVLNGNNSYTGGTRLNGGTLEVGHSNALGSGALLVHGAGTLQSNTAVTLGNAVTLDAALTLAGSHDLTLGGAISGAGNLIKNGTGTVTLTGANSATGGTTIQAGRLVASAGSLASGAITNNAELELHQASDATLNQTISGSGSFTKTGAGTLTLAGVNTSTGDTIISAGSLVASAANLASGAITNNAALELHQISDATLAQAISGSGSFTKTGTGKLTVTGANTSTGETIISAGTLVASAANLASGAITNNAALELNQASDATLAQKISGSGSLTKAGAGVLTLTGNSSNYTGSTLVANGGLLLGSTAKLGGTVTVASGATLAGTGNVGSTGSVVAVQSGATIAAGDASSAYGTLRVAGDLVLEQGASYQVQADPNSSASSLIKVAGKATLAGSVLHVGNESNAATDFQVGKTYTILQAGQVDGTFSAAASNYAYLDVGLGYLKTNEVTTDVTLTLERNDTAFASLAQTPNQASAARGIESLPRTHQLYQYVQKLANGAPAAVFASLSGEVQASVGSSLVGLGAFAPGISGQHLRNNMTAGLRAGAPVAQSDGPLPASAWPSSKALPAWAEVVGHWQRYDSDGNAAQLKQRTTGLFLGMDEEVGTSGWRLGGSVGYTNADGKVADRSSESDVNSYSAAVYGGKSFGTGTGPRINVLGGLAYTWHDIETTRRVTSLGQTLKADYNAHTAQLFAEVGYAIGQYDKVGFEPFAGVSLGQQRTGSFQERGGFAALKGRSSTDDLASTTLGLRVHSDFQLAGKEGRLRATVGWRHAFGDVTGKKTMAFEGSQNFTVAGTPLARNTAVLGLEADVALSRSAALVLGYQGEMGSGQRDHSANVKLRWAF